MLKGGISEVKVFRGDVGYDTFKFREMLGSTTEQIIPPWSNGVVRKGKDYLSNRNDAIEDIKLNGSKSWKENSGYHLRSRNENVMYRYKVTFGGDLESRRIEIQESEVLIKCTILNRHRSLGFPISYKVK